MKMQSKTRTVIVSATSCIAQECARLWVIEKDAELILVGRDRSRTESVAQDLRVRAPQASIEVMETNFEDPQAIQTLADTIASTGKIDRVLIAQGILPQQADCQQDLNISYNTLMIDAVSPALFAEAFVGHLQKNNHGTLALLGSVAGDRARKSMYTYGSAKALLEHFARGLQHRCAHSKVKVVLIKPGPTNTPMTTHLEIKGIKFASANRVAKDIVSAMNRGKLVVYTPKIWFAIMTIIRIIPSFIFNKMNL